jgi:hypothetical protein
MAIKPGAASFRGFIGNSVLEDLGSPTTIKALDPLPQALEQNHTTDKKIRIDPTIASPESQNDPTKDPSAISTASAIIGPAIAVIAMSM